MSRHILDRMQQPVDSIRQTKEKFILNGWEGMQIQKKTVLKMHRKSAPSVFALRFSELARSGSVSLEYKMLVVDLRHVLINDPVH